MANERLIVYGVVALGVVAAAYYAKSKIGGMIPLVVQDGVQASGQILANWANMLTDPLDAFGIRPSSNQYILTTPWADTLATTQDSVSNNNLGVNFNYF